MEESRPTHDASKHETSMESQLHSLFSPRLQHCCWHAHCLRLLISFDSLHAHDDDTKQTILQKSKINKFVELCSGERRRAGGSVRHIRCAEWHIMCAGLRKYSQLRNGNGRILCCRSHHNQRRTSRHAIFGPFHAHMRWHSGEFRRFCAIPTKCAAYH